MSTEAPRSAEPVASDLTDLARQCGGYPLDSVPEWTVMTPQDLLQFRAALASSHPTPAEPAPSEGGMDAEHWAELYRLREAVKGPAGYATWQDAATDERIRRVKAERELKALATPQRAEPTTEQAAAECEAVRDLLWADDSKHQQAAGADACVVALRRIAAPHRPAAARLSDEQRGEIAYQLTKRHVIDMPTARAAVDAALKGQT